MSNKVCTQIKGQAGLELIAMIGFVLLIFIIVAATAIEKHRESNVLKTLLDAKRIANSVADNINTISEQGSGYYRYFSIPEKIFGYYDYNITTSGSIVEISWWDQGWSTQVIASNVTILELKKGNESNCVVNKNGKICIMPRCDKIAVLLYNTHEDARDDTLLNDIQSRCNVKIVETNNITDLKNYNALRCYDILWFAYNSVYGSSGNNLSAEAEVSIKRYVNEGGKVWASSQEDTGWAGAWHWLPYEVGLASSEDNKTGTSDSELFSDSHIIDVGRLRMGEPYQNWNTAYRVLAYQNASTEYAHFLDLKYSQGIYLLSSVDVSNPSYDNYTTQLFENAIIYLNPRFEC